MKKSNLAENESLDNCIECLDCGALLSIDDYYCPFCEGEQNV